MSSLDVGPGQGEHDAPLTDREVALVKRLFSDPFAIPLEFKAWLVSYLETNPPLLTTASIFGFRSVIATQIDAGQLAAAPVIGTSFPASPADLQEAIIMDSLTAPTYAWRFIYMAGIADAYKWVCFGPVQFQDLITAEENIGVSGSWQNLATDGPLFTVPFAGIYDCFGQANGVNTSGGIQGAQIGITIGNTIPSDYLPMNVPISGRQIGTLYKQITAAAADVIKLRYQTTSTASFDFGYRVLRVAPVRVAG